MKLPTIIAEVKTFSPFGFKSDKSWDELFSLALKVGDIISIHTDPRWGGSFENIKKAKSLTKKPILAKGIHSKDEEVISAILAGADYVLIVGRIPDIKNIDPSKFLIEPNTLEELKRIPKNIKAVWNSRDLSSGGMKKESFLEARKIFGGWLCQASNIKSVNDIQKGANAILVGQNLDSFYNSL